MMEPPTSSHQSALRIIKPKGKPAFIGKYDKSEVVKWRKEFVDRLKDYRSLERIEAKKAVHVHIVLCYTAPKSRPIVDGKIRPKVTKPDVDNVVKTILDGLVEAGVMETDEQVYSLRVVKVEWEQGMILINVTEVGDEWMLPDDKIAS